MKAYLTRSPSRFSLLLRARRAAGDRGDVVPRFRPDPDPDKE